MAKRMSRRLIPLFVFFTLFYSTVYSDNQRTEIKLATGEWTPYISEDYQNFGFIPAIIEEAFALKDIKTDFQFYPWKRALIESEMGRVEGVAVWGGYLSWIESHYGSDPVYTDELLIWMRADEMVSDWRDPKAVDGYTMGLLRGEMAGSEIQGFIDTGILKVHNVNSEDQKIQLLKAGRIDMTVINRTSGAEALNRLYDESERSLIQPHPIPIRVSLYRVLFPRNNEESVQLLKLLNEGLQDLRISGRYDQLFEEYFPNQ